MPTLDASGGIADAILDIQVERRYGHMNGRVESY